MNHIINNKIKFEKNNYIPKKQENILTSTQGQNQKPQNTLLLNSIINENVSWNMPITMDFKLKQYQHSNLQLALNKNKLANKNLFKNTLQNRVQNKDVPYYKKDELIINLYGAAILNKNLYDFLLILSKDIKIKIYIYTWNTSKSALDYYFQGLNVKIFIVSIDELDQSQSIDISNNVFSSNLPLSSWNLMWKSMFHSINEIYKRENQDNTIILNTTFNINYDFKINNFKNLINSKFSKNIFLKDSLDLSGVDNPIIGDKYTLYKLINTFYYNMENISMFYNSLKIPEASIFYENNRLFGVNYNNMFENIEMYNTTR